MSLNLIGGLVFAAVLSLFIGIAASRKGGSHKYETAIKPSTADYVVEGDQNDVLANKRLSHLGHLESEALKAGLHIKGSHFVMVAAFAATGAFTLALGLTSSWKIAVWATLVGLVAPKGWLNYQKSRRAQAFEKRLDGALGVAISAFQAGASLAQAITQVAEADLGPVSEEFSRVDRAVKLGLSPMEAIAKIRERVDCPDLDLVVVGTQIMAKSGGNLVRIYENAAEVVRERRNFREAMKACTAQPRLSAGVVSLIPVGLTLFIRALNPGYFAPMPKSSGGRVAFVLCFVSILVGWLVARRVVSVEVK